MQSTQSPPPPPGDRSATFQAMEGATETRSGTTLMVEAYAVLWMILLGWVVFLWRRANALDARLGELERTIDKAAAATKK